MEWATSVTTEYALKIKVATGIPAHVWENSNQPTICRRRSKTANLQPCLKIYARRQPYFDEQAERLQFWGVACPVLTFAVCSVKR